MWYTMAHVENIPTENVHVVWIATIFCRDSGGKLGPPPPLVLHRCRVEKLTSLLFWWDRDNNQSPGDFTGAQAACVVGYISCTHLLLRHAWLKADVVPLTRPTEYTFLRGLCGSQRYPGIVFLPIIKDRQTDTWWFFRRLSRESNLIGNRYPHITLWLCVSLPLPERSLHSFKVSHWLQHWLLLLS